MSGLFLTFEGIDGCGKSTQARLALERLEEAGRECIMTREPGGTPIAEKIRELLLSPENDAMGDRCELLLYLASRAQHLVEKVVPAVERGQVVLCDRFAEATFAYQGYGRGLDLERLIELNTYATGGVVPDCTFVFDIGLTAAAARMDRMGKSPDRLEGNSRDFFQRVRDGYLELASHFSERIVVIDGEQEVDIVARHVWDGIEKRLHS